MTANVWFYVVPSQRELVAATKAGLPQDPALSIAPSSARSTTTT